MKAGLAVLSAQGALGAYDKLPRLSPHLYELTPREKPFHGVQALRLNPVGGADEIFGRVGLLAHTYMLGPNGD